MSGDIRTVDKLLDATNRTRDDHHMWLSGFNNTVTHCVQNREIHKRCNIISILFHTPVSISYLKIWNYAKSLTRGVKEYMILLDHNIIYRVN